MKLYTVKSPLDHDGRAYAVGETVELDDDQAAALSDQVIEPAPKDAPPPRPAKGRK